MEHDLNQHAAACSELCKKQGWDRGWSASGCYLHLESSELIEALRGKRGDPVDEAADVMFVLLSICAGNVIEIDQVMEHLATKVKKYAP